MSEPVMSEPSPVGDVLGVTELGRADDEPVLSEPGRVAPGPVMAGTYCTEEVCITCSDQAVPVCITELRPDDLALARTEAGTVEEISVALVDAQVGDVVLVHAKEALTVVGARP
jgi:hydrogenase expression/formation protein HypC